MDNLKTGYPQQDRRDGKAILKLNTCGKGLLADYYSALHPH